MIMTRNNFKTVLFASLIATIILPLGSSNLVEASDADSIKNVVIKTEKFKNHIMDDAAKKLVKIEQKLEDADTSAKEEEILHKMQQVKQDALSKLPEVNPEKELEYRLSTAKLVEKLVDENRQSLDKRVIPFTTVGYSSVADAILVGIDPDHVTPQDMQRYADFIADIVPNHIKVIVEPGDRVYSDECPTASFRCDPIEGGTQMQMQDHGYCTVGLKATYNGAEGFVTAGHCTDGSTGDDVGQPTLARVIGTVVRETFDRNNWLLYCDCAFIESTVSVAEAILGLSDRYYRSYA